MMKKKLFLASSAELSEDRKAFEIFVNRRNKEWGDKGVFIELIAWEDFLDAISRTRLQDEYNKAIRDCDLFVMLFWTKVGRYTEEEFETAFGQFKASGKPFIFTYFKDAEVSADRANKRELMSLWAFQEKLDALGHFCTRYQTIDGLKLHFGQQLDKLAASGFIEFEPAAEPPAGPSGTSYHASLTGSGAIAQGRDATAVGRGGVQVVGNNTGNINTGSQTSAHTGGGAFVAGNVNIGRGDFVGRDRITYGITPDQLETLFAPLAAAVAQHTTASEHAAAAQQLAALEAEVAKGEDAEDGKVGTILDGLAAMVPGAVAAVVGLFATPILQGIAGPVTRSVLDKLKPG